MKSLLLVAISSLAVFLPSQALREGGVVSNSYPAQKSVQQAQISPQEPLQKTYEHLLGGNDYYAGECVWYVANRIPVMAGLGNARDWLGGAQSMGVPTGDKPKVNAVAWEVPGASLGHVMAVEEVYPDGSFLASEMNYVGHGVVDTRVITDLSDWKFIYF